MIVTFYSFKGGVGRSMALANVAEVLADLGYHVIVCDWDLEAPGLERYLAGSKEESDRLAESPGLMDLLLEYKGLLSASSDVADQSSTHTRVGDLWLRRPSSRAVLITSWKTRTGSLRLLTAGRRGSEYSRYADAVRTFDWDDFYREWAGGAYMDFLRDDLSAGRAGSEENDALTPAADIVLIDSRTGVTEHGGVATHHLADAVVILSAANDLNLDGTTWMANALFKKELTELRGGRPLSILPVATRIEQTAEKDLVNKFRQRFTERFSPYLPAALGTPAEFFLDSEIPYLPFYSFTERVAASERPEVRDQLLYRKYETLAHALLECGAALNVLPSSSIPLAVRLRNTQRVAEAPRGIFALHASSKDRATGSALAAALSAAGVSVWAEATVPAPLIRDAPKLAGTVIVVTPDTPLGWVGAEVDEAFRKSALDPEFRIVPVIAGSVSYEVLRHMDRLRVVSIGRDPATLQVGPVVAALAARSTVAAADTPANPSSLAAFDETGARFFFGRDHDLTLLAASIAAAQQPVRWIQIEGKPGVGKTSFVRASVVPALRRGVLVQGTVAGPVAFTSLGADPVGALAVALAATGDSAITGARLKSDLEKSANHLSEFIKHVTPAGATFILVVDDVERTTAHTDVMRMVVGAAERLDVPLLLVTIGSTGTPGHTAAIPGTVRYELTAITTEDCVAAATGQAAAAGLTVEPPVWDALTRDLKALGGEGNVAPLLQLVLSELSRHRSGTAITLSAYERVGGPLRALVAAAESRIESLPEARRASAMRLLVGLTASKADGTAERKTISRAEALQLVGGDNPELVLKHLSAHPGLIRADIDVELAHPILLRRWERLRGWIEEDRKAAFVKQRNWWVAGVAAAAVVLILLTNFVQWSTERGSHGVQDSELLAMKSQQQQRTHPVRGLALALAAADSAETDAAKAALERALAARYPLIVLEHPTPVTDAGFSEDGTRVISGAEDGVRIWESLSGETPGAAKVRTTFNPNGRVTSVRFSPDGRNAGVTEFDGPPVLINVASSAVTHLRGHTGAVLNSNFSSDSRSFVTAGFDGVALVWEVATARVVRELKGHTDSVTSASFDAANSTILTTSLDGTAMLWSRTGRPIPPPLSVPDSRAPIKSGMFGGSGVLIGGPDGVVLRRQNDSMVATIPGGIAAFAFSSNGRTIALTNGTTIQVTQVEPASDSRDLAVPDEGDGRRHVTQISLDSSGRQLAAGTVDGTVVLWNLDGDLEPLFLRGHTASVNRVRFSVDGKRLLTAAADNTAAVWDIASSTAPPDQSFATLRETARSVVSKLLTPEQLAALAGK